MGLLEQFSCRHGVGAGVTSICACKGKWVVVKNHGPFLDPYYNTAPNI